MRKPYGSWNLKTGKWKPAPEPPLLADQHNFNYQYGLVDAHCRLKPSFPKREVPSG